MKITKRQLRRIIREVSAGDNYTVGRPDPRGTDHLFPDDPEHLLNKRDELATQIRHASKDIYGTKDHYDLRGKSVEELEDILYDLANSQEQRYLDDEARIEMEDEMGYDPELSRAEMAPRRQGMSRRPAGSKSQRRMESRTRLKDRLRKVIREWAPKSKGDLPPKYNRPSDVDVEFADIADTGNRRKVIARLAKEGVSFDSDPKYYQSNLSDKVARIAYQKAVASARMKHNEDK